MYNEEASKYGATMANWICITKYGQGQRDTFNILRPKMGMEATSLTRTLKSMEEKRLIVRKKIQTMVAVY
jgi:DNA-binding MarR family transcriptional regulator